MKNIFDIVRCIAGRTEDVFACLKEFGITFNSFRDAERLASLYNDYHKTVRMPCSLGYTPEKLHDMYPPSGHEQSIPRAKYPSGAEKREIGYRDFSQSVFDNENAERFGSSPHLEGTCRDTVVNRYGNCKRKISRNTPYTCGSGKKHKRCSGK